jgi:CHAT domain-containing protein
VEERKIPLGRRQSILAILPDAASLPFAKEEVTTISTLFAGVQILESGDASAARILKVVGDFDIIHVAAHGKKNERYPLNSYIVCADRPLELSEIARLQINPRLVFLSACEVGYVMGNLGHLHTGHEAVSFPTSFLVAGASTVIAPLWLVEDRTTSQLVSLFYQTLRNTPSPGRTFSNALASSQRQYIASKRVNGKIPHPFSWAAFSLTGDSR